MYKTGLFGHSGFLARILGLGSAWSKADQCEIHNNTNNNILNSEHLAGELSVSLRAMLSSIYYSVLSDFQLRCSQARSNDQPDQTEQ